MQNAMIPFEVLDRLSANRKVVDAACPLCGPDCKSPLNTRRKVMRLWSDGDFITYKCARCEASGYAREAGSTATRPSRPPPVDTSPPEKDKSELAAYLWSKSMPITGTAAEAYLACRKCSLTSSSLRFLPARGGHPPAMIARFGDFGAPTGVHLTKLKTDGSGKAGTDSDKIMIGSSRGQPIMVADNQDREELIVAEGIEDAATLAIATGWSAWAAGSAGRLPAVVAAAPASAKMFYAADLDWGKKDKVRSGPRELAKSIAVRPDLIPLHFEKALGVRESIDANKAMIRFGAEAVVAVVEWCEAQAMYARGIIGFDAMLRTSRHSQDVFAALLEREEYPCLT